MADMTQEEIDAKLAGLEEPQEEVEVEPEEEEVVEEEESAPSPDDTDDEEPAESAGDDDEEEEVDLSKSEKGLLEATKAERRKRQEAEEKLDRLQSSLDNLQETVTSSQAPKTLADAYERDQKGVTDNINANIAQANEDGNIVEVERLRDLKADLRQQSSTKESNTHRVTQQQQEIANLLTSKIPDFGKDKAKELTAFAIDQLEYTDADLTEKTNISKHGVGAVNEIVRINKLFEKSKAPTTAKKKKVKKATTVEKGGKAGKKSVASTQKLIDEARKSGDWSAVLEAREL